LEAKLLALRDHPRAVDFWRQALCSGIAKIDQSKHLSAAFHSEGRLMYYVAAALAGLSALFYAAGHNEIGSLGVMMCRYGGTFCDNPVYVLVAAALAAVWGAFVSVR
jgi:hypothetical protein